MELELYDALGQLKNAPSLPEYYVGDEVGYVKVTSDMLVGSAVGPTDTALPGMSITINGDGVNETLLTVSIHGFVGGAAANYNLRLWEGAVNSGTLVQQVTTGVSTASFTGGMPTLLYRIPPFQGTKTFNAAWYVGVNTTMGRVHAGTTYPAEMRAVRLKSAPQFYPPQMMAYAPLNNADLTAQAPHNSEIILRWQSIQYDTHIMWTSAFPTRFYAKMAGLYEINPTGWIAAGGPANQIVYVGIKHTEVATGTSRIYYSSTPLTAGSVNSLTGNISAMTETIPMAAGDYFEIVLYQWNASGVVKAFQSGINGTRVRARWAGPSVVGVWEQTDTGWIELPTLQNGWALYNSGDVNYRAAYRRKNGIVHLRGLLSGGTVTSDTLLFTLPAGFRPTIEHHFGTISNAGFAGVGVHQDGRVRTKIAASNTWLSLDNVHFPADQ